MINKYRWLLFLAIYFSSFFIFAQKNEYNSARIDAIDANTTRLQNIHNFNASLVEKLAQKLKIEIRRTLGSGRIIELKGQNEIGEPIFTATESNLLAGQTTHTNYFYTGGKLGLSLSGNSQAIIGRLGVWDGGKVLNTHVEFGNRVTQIDNSTSTSSHSTHVAGTMVAEGINANAHGMANTASLKAWDYNNDDTEMSAASKELLVSNHSYGQVCGWVYNDSRTTDQKWEWYGSPQVNAFEDYKFGFYESQSQSWDKIAYNSPNYLIVKSAGNSRGETGPGISKTDTTKTLEKYFLGSGSDTSFVARSRNDGYDCLPTYSVAKNILTVGAVSIIANGPSLASDIKISSFSSWGPTDDGRIKPDIVGAGVNLFSTNNASNNSYAFLSGTSMAAPQVAGSIFLLQELYAQLNKNKLMRSSTLKGLVLHTATDAGKLGPDYIYGWGILNMEKAANVLLNKQNTNSLDELTLNQSEIFTKKVVAIAREPLIATICWTDPEGTGTSATQSNVNNRTPKLVNDLDIAISDGTNSFKAWVLDPNKPAALAAKGDNFRDNVEQVFIANPVPGKEYTITITHKSNLKNNLQDYALIISGLGGKAYCTSAPNNANDTKIEKVVLNNITYEAKAGCTTYTDYTNIPVEISANQKIALELSLGSCGIQKDKAFHVYADWNIDGDFDDDGEKVVDGSTLSATLKSNTNFTIPTNINPGSSTRLRIVTSEANQISPCGNYSYGETIDFLLSFISPKNDLAVTSLVYPDENICVNSSINSVSIKLENKGTNVVNSGAVIVWVFENGIKYENLKFDLKNPIPGLSNSILTFPINVTFKPNSEYKFQIQSIIKNDENELNDTFSQIRKVADNTNSTNVKAVECSNDNRITLFANGKGAAFWYDAEIGGNLLAVGNNVPYSKPANPTFFYASQNDLKGSIGPKSKKEFAGGTYSGNFGPKPLITTKAPLRLESARLYIGQSGKITFTVERVSDQTPISSVTLDVVATRDPKLGNASNGQQLDDPNDSGAVYNLSLDIPEAGSYQISIDYEDGASIFRSNQGVSGFPFGLQNVVNITGSSFNGGVLTAAWYYFYDLKIGSLGCPSTNRTLAVNTIASGTFPTISVLGSTALCPNESVTLSTSDDKNLEYQWLKDTEVIGEAKSSKILISSKGNYAVKVSLNGICPAVSNAVSIQIKSPLPPTITSEVNLLTASESETYQWLLSRNPIAGATQKTFTTYVSGSYAVQGKIDGCLLMSNEIFVTILADEIVKIGENLQLFPNPTEAQLNIKLPEFVKIKDIPYQIYGENGNMLQSGSFKIDYSTPGSIPLNDLSTGQYLLIMQINGRSFLKKFIKL